ncbi:MAG TPA: NYN domain-containing protein [Anaerolineae bacterium]
MADMSHQVATWIIKLSGEVRSLQTRAAGMELDAVEKEVKRCYAGLRMIYKQIQTHGVELMTYYEALADVEARLKNLQTVTHTNGATEKIALFIDAANLDKMCRKWLRQDIDFAKLLTYFGRDAIILRAFYYTAIETEEEVRSNPFLFWLKRNGYHLVTKPIKTFTDGEKKGNLDIEIAIDMLELADKLDRAVLFSGDGDFAPLLKRVGMKGVRTQVVSYGDRGEGPTAADLLDTVDVFTDLGKLIRFIAK